MNDRRRFAVALVAEDEPLLRMEAVDTLAEAGFTVLEAANATDALRHLETVDEVDLLFTDVAMPGPLDGVDLAHEVARRWPRVALVVCSGRIRAGDRDLPEQARFVDKPFSPRSVAVAIEAARREAARPAASEIS